jgi:glycosyltransferase involved in cell wall biosynthesis
MKGRIYILCHQFPPTNIVGALRPFRLAKHLGSRGWKAVIITIPPKHQNALDFSLLEELKKGTIIEYVKSSRKIIIDDSNYFISEVKRAVHTINGPKNNSRHLLNRASNAIRYLSNRIMLPDRDLLLVPHFFLKLRNNIKQNRKNIILTTSPGHSIHLVGLMMSYTKKNILWIVDFRDPWDHYPNQGHYDLTNPMERWMEREVIKRADAVISTTETNSKNLLKKHNDLNENKFFTITNTFNESKIAVAAKKDPEKFVISHTGIFYPDKDPFTFFRALRSWFDDLDIKQREKYKKILRINLIGAQKNIADKIINGPNLKSIIRFIDRVSHDKAVQFTKASDMALICTGIGKKSRPGWLPSKLIEYLGCRVPILAICREGDMAEVIRKTNSGYVITSENHKKIHLILEKEIEKKISNSSNIEFTFQGISKFEEKSVMTEMIKIVENLD